jgi:hypothetical protein
MSYLGCSVRLYPQLFVEELMSYLGCSVRLYPQLFVEELMSYLGCSVRLYPQLFVGGLMSYLGWSVRLYPQLFVGGLMSYVFFVCLHIVLSTTYCVVFLFCFLRLVCPMLPVSLDCPFLIAPSVLSNVYLLIQPLVIEMPMPCQES